MTKRSRITEIAVVLIIILWCGGFFGFLLRPFWTSDVRPWEEGRDVPSEEPQEANRVIHPHGFSIVIPKNWEVLVWAPDNGTLASSIASFPKCRIPRRSSASLGVVQGTAEPPPDLTGYGTTTFQGNPAFRRVFTREGVFLDDPPQFVCVLWFQRDKNWYRILYRVCEERENLPPIVQRYFETFRIEPPADRDQNAPFVEEKPHSPETPRQPENQ
jgi:hypothetical protein